MQRTDAASNARTLAVVLGVRGTFRLIPSHRLQCCADWCVSDLPHCQCKYLDTAATILLTLLIVCFMVFYPVQVALLAAQNLFLLTVVNCLLLAGSWLIGASV